MSSHPPDLKYILDSSLVSTINTKKLLTTFERVCRKVGAKNHRESIRDLVTYEMIDGMRTTVELEGVNAYVEGGLFSLRLIHLLELLGAKTCYINVTEEKHRLRPNYSEILKALRRLYTLYEIYADKLDIRYKFLGEAESAQYPLSEEDHKFMEDLKVLEEKTRNNNSFTACFLINYSLEWAMQNMSLFETLPDINVIIRHTKLQIPTGMMLPPLKSDYTSLVYVQQGALSRTWTDYQLLCLAALALRSMLLNRGTQYVKAYDPKEKDKIRIKREVEAVFVHKQLFEARGELQPCSMEKGLYGIKRAILGTPFGPEVYEF